MTEATIRRGTPKDLPEIQTVNLAAFEPIHRSFAEILGPEVNSLVYPNWQESQQRELAELIEKPNAVLIVAELHEHVVGFVVVQVNLGTQVGELAIIAVHPNSSRQGIGALLNEHALEVMRSAGMKLAELGTGGDPAHAAARRGYERAGYAALPSVRYYKAS